MGTSDPDAVRLLNCKKPTEEDVRSPYDPITGLDIDIILRTKKTAGDFPTVLFEVLSKRSSIMSTSLSIAQVNEALDDLAKAGGKL